MSENATEEKRGLECRHCGCKHFRVIYTRPAWGGRIMRRRECRHCGRRVTTWERIIGQPLAERALTETVRETSPCHPSDRRNGR